MHFSNVLLDKRSCLTNLLQFVENVTDYIDQGYPVGVIFLDFQKALDRVPTRQTATNSQSPEYWWVKWRIGLISSLVTGNNGLLLMTNVLIDPMLVLECPKDRSCGLYFFNIYK